MIKLKNFSGKITAFTGDNMFASFDLEVSPTQEVMITNSTIVVDRDEKKKDVIKFSYLEAIGNSIEENIGKKFISRLDIQEKVILLTPEEIEEILNQEFLKAFKIKIVSNAIENYIASVFGNRYDKEAGEIVLTPQEVIDMLNQVFLKSFKIDIVYPEDLVEYLVQQYNERKKQEQQTVNNQGDNTNNNQPQNAQSNISSETTEVSSSELQKET